MRKLIIYGNLTRLHQESTFGCYEFQVTNMGVEHPITTIYPASELVTIKACLSGAKAPSQYATQFDVRPQECGFLITAKYSLDEEPLRGEYSRMECLEPMINAVLGEALSSVASSHQCSEVAANINVDNRIVTEGKVYDIQVKKRAARRNLDNLISWVASSLTISLLFVIATVVSLFTSNNITLFISVVLMLISMVVTLVGIRKVLAATRDLGDTIVNK